MKLVIVLTALLAFAIMLSCVSRTPYDAVAYMIQFPGYAEARAASPMFVADVLQLLDRLQIARDSVEPLDPLYFDPMTHDGMQAAASAAPGWVVAAIQNVYDLKKEARRWL